jgi:hypothetical protein
MEPWVLKAQQDRKVLKALSDHRELKAFLVLKEFKDFRDLLDLIAIKIAAKKSSARSSAKKISL